MPGRLRVLKHQTIFKGKVFEIYLDRVREPSGVTAEREIVSHSGSVVVLPLLDDGRVVLARQYRYAARDWLWELVAGGMERGETPERAGRRELLEETGYRARQSKLLLDWFASPGFLTERMFLVEARGLTLVEARPEVDERIEVGRFTLADLGKMIRAKKIRDAKTLVGILWHLHARRGYL